MSAVRSTLVSILLAIGMCINTQVLCYSNRTNNDPYPPHSARYPYEYLTTCFRDYEKGLIPEECEEWISFSASGFRQSANLGRNIDKVVVELGDLRGRWNMLGLMYLGNGADPSVVDCLMHALGLDTMTPADCLVGVTNCIDYISNPKNSDPLKQFGFFSIPMIYRKDGLRFEFEMKLFCNVGIKIEGGVTEILQTAVFNDQTCQATGPLCALVCTNATGPSCTTGAISGTNPPCLQTVVNSGALDVEQFTSECKRLVIQRIMDQRELVAKALGLNIKNFCIRGPEDTYLSLYWRKVMPVNQHREEWPYFLLMPFAAFEVVAPSGKKVNPNQLFAVPTGNNGHWGIGGMAGVNFDFVNTIEFGLQSSMTHWLPRSYCNAPVPTHDLQQGMFPYKADYRLHPGTNWTFSASLYAYHFLDRLSCLAQYIAVTHCGDCFDCVNIKPLDCHLNCIPNASGVSGNPIEIGDTPIVLTGKMSNESKWKSQVINATLTYDLSPHIAIGVLWQFPVSRRNAYRSTTILGSVIATF